MTDERIVQEAEAERRNEEIVQEARDVRTRLNEALDRVENELRNVRQVASELPPTSVQKHQRGWWWPWGMSSF